jgi:hypothetical protein
MREGSLVLLHLTEPTEKYWGLLTSLNAAGATLRGLNLSSFDDWMVEVASEDEAAIAPTTIFFPLRRIECMFLDERVGPVQSYAERFEARIGASVLDHVGTSNDMAVLGTDVA